MKADDLIKDLTSLLAESAPESAPESDIGALAQTVSSSFYMLGQFYRGLDEALKSLGSGVYKTRAENQARLARSRASSRDVIKSGKAPSDTSLITALKRTGTDIIRKRKDGGSYIDTRGFKGQVGDVLGLKGDPEEGIRGLLDQPFTGEWPFGIKTPMDIFDPPERPKGKTEPIFDYSIEHNAPIIGYEDPNTKMIPIYKTTKRKVGEMPAKVTAESIADGAKPSPEDKKLMREAIHILGRLQQMRAEDYDKSSTSNVFSKAARAITVKKWLERDGKWVEEEDLKYFLDIPVPLSFAQRALQELKQYSLSLEKAKKVAEDLQANWSDYRKGQTSTRSRALKAAVETLRERQQAFDDAKSTIEKQTEMLSRKLRVLGRRLTAQEAERKEAASDSLKLQKVNPESAKEMAARAKNLGDAVTKTKREMRGLSSSLASKVKVLKQAEWAYQMAAQEVQTISNRKATALATAGDVEIVSPDKIEAAIKVVDQLVKILGSRPVQTMRDPDKVPPDFYWQPGGWQIAPEKTPSDQRDAYMKALYMAAMIDPENKKSGKAKIVDMTVSQLRRRLFDLRNDVVEALKVKNPVDPETMAKEDLAAKMRARLKAAGTDIGDEPSAKPSAKSKPKEFARAQFKGVPSKDPEIQAAAEEVKKAASDLKEVEPTLLLLYNSMVDAGQDKEDIYSAMLAGGLDPKQIKAYFGLNKPKEANEDTKDYTHLLNIIECLAPSVALDLAFGELCESELSEADLQSQLSAALRNVQKTVAAAEGVISRSKALLDTKVLGDPTASEAAKRLPELLSDKPDTPFKGDAGLDRLREIGDILSTLMNLFSAKDESGKESSPEARMLLTWKVAIDGAASTYSEALMRVKDSDKAKSKILPAFHDDPILNFVKSVSPSMEAEDYGQQPSIDPGLRTSILNLYDVIVGRLDEGGNAIFLEFVREAANRLMLSARRILEGESGLAVPLVRSLHNALKQASQAKSISPTERDDITLWLNEFDNSILDPLDRVAADLPPVSFS